MTTAEFDADTTHPWATRWRIPRVTTSHPEWRYEVALVVPRPDDPLLLDGELLEPTEIEAEIIGSFIDYRRSYYREGYAAEKLERAFDVDGTTNTVILAKNVQGWRYRRASYQHGLWPLWNNPEKQAEFPPTRAGLAALLDHINNLGRSWSEWKAEHPLPAEEGNAA